jgi:adenylate cyclase
MHLTSANRKLAAIVSADVVGYSRLMGSDEEGTLAALKSLRSELIDPTVQAHHGRIVKTIGDGLLIEYPSVVDALQCWLTVQQSMAIRNESIPDKRQIRFRVGVNIGDIIVDDDDIFGDGVNIAARLEAIAAPGGICASSAVVEQTRQKMQVNFEDLGMRSLKNIEKPIRVYRVSSAVLSTKDDAGRITDGTPNPEKIVLPERPSIAIMPFRNVSGDHAYDYIADGISLGIQTLMVQLPGLFLINAVSHQGYRDKTQTVAEATKELPVQYALEGAVQCAGHRVRVTAQVTDLKTAAVVWAARYDHDLEDIFALQDEITRKVISALNVKLVHRADLDRVMTSDLRGDGAWEYFLRGLSHIYQFSKEDNEQARQLFETLFKLRPDKVHGPSFIAFTYWLELTRGWTENPEQSRKMAAKWAVKAMEYKENNGLGHMVMGFIRLHERKYDEARALCETSLQYRANCPGALGQEAAIQLYCGDPQRAVKSARESLTVRHAYQPVMVNLLANAYRDSGEIELSIAAAEEAARLERAHTDGLVTLCIDNVFAGDNEKAERVAAEILEIDPGFTVKGYAAKHPYRDDSTLKRLAEALRSAGLPE